MLGSTSMLLSAGRRLVVAGVALLAAAALAVPALGARGKSALDYRGYRITVPTGWPVFDLRAHPTTCVRFNRHAVYLGRPGTRQQCPPGAVGRTEAILLEPLDARRASSVDGSGVILPAAGETAGQAVIAAHGVLATATWSAKPWLVRRALGIRSLRPIPAPARAGGVQRAAANARAARARPTARAASSVYTGPGFDACAAPSPSQMSAWGASPYRAIGIYIGGTNMACSQPNLTAGWISEEAAAGWHFIPTYVGLQAPYDSCGCASITPSNAASEGTAAAQDAVAQASNLGLGPGNPIFFDMEGYARGADNTSAVLAFLAAWTNELHAQGYLSGVYSSADSGIVDLANQFGTGYPEPDDLWLARWNGAQTTSDSSLAPSEWANHQRLHQYAGDSNQTYGGVRLDVDSDYLDGATAGPGAGAAALPPLIDGTFVNLSGTSLIFEMVGGAPLYVNDPSLVGSSPVVSVTQQQFDSLQPLPADGTFLTTTTGATYRIAGGAPLLVTTWEVFGGPQTTTTVDEWDIQNIANPVSHLNRVPASGTFLTTTNGKIYRVAGGAPFRVSAWSVFGRPQPSVTVDAWNVWNAGSGESHLQARPADGTIVEGLPSRWYWVFYGGWRYRTSPTSAAVSVDDAAIPAFPSQHPLPLPQCTVPRLAGLTFAQAKQAISSALCKLGKVGRPHRWPPHHKLRVYWQIPGPRKPFAEGHRIGIKMR